jgi:hypothetical protein
MSLTDRAREARVRAETSTDTYDHALAAALTAAEHAEAREQLAGVGEVDPADYEGATEFPAWRDVCPAQSSRNSVTSAANSLACWNRNPWAASG